MQSIIPATSTTGAVVNQIFPAISWQPFQTQISPLQDQGIADHICIYNESQCGLLVRMRPSVRTFRIPAGGWVIGLDVTLGGVQDTDLTAQVEYVMSNPSVMQIGVDYYAPGEPVVASRTLGNSPIGGSVSGLVAQYLTNTGLSTPTGIIDIANTSNTGGMLLDNNGTMTFGVASGAGSQNVISTVAGINPSETFGWGLGSLGLGGYGGAASVFKGQLQGMVTAVASAPSLGALQTGISSQTFSGANDVAGRINVTTTGTPPGAGAPIAVVTFGTTFPSGHPLAFLLTGAGFDGSYFVTSIGTTGFTINTVAALAGTTTYGIYYWIIG